MSPLSTVLSVTMTQIVSTLASLLARGSGIPATTPPPRQHCTHSSLLLLDLLQELVSLLALDMAAFLTVFGPLVQHCQQEAASTKLVSSAPSFSLCCCLCTN